MNRHFSLVSIVSLSLLIFSCGTSELKEQNLSLQFELDSISIILDETEKAVQTLAEIQGLLDTIESKRDIMRIDMVEGGIRYEDYAKRVEALGTYLDQAETRIAKLERSGRSSASLVKKLRAEIEEKNRQIEALEKIMEDFKTENASLKGTVKLQQGEIEDLELNIQIAEKELELLETKIQEMIEVSQMSEADGYFARAAAYEEAANRTKLAPRKKKETLKQALELYHKAQDMGHEGAQAKIDELSKKVE